MMKEIRNGYIGNPAQMVTLRRLELREGRGKGNEIIEVATAGGLALDILPDMGLDIGQTRFKGINMSWLSKNGYDSPASFQPFDNEFPNYFSGGLLYTCGLRSAGLPNRDGDEFHPLHGRFHGLQAEQVSAETEGDEIVIKGVIRECAMFAHELEVKRSIRIPVYGSSVTVEDKITNLTPRDEEYMQVYHCNFGYPFLSEEAHLVLPEDRETVPRTEWAKTGMEKTTSFEKPVDSEEERVFFQKMSKEFYARLENPVLGIDMTISWSGETLPVMNEWRSMASGEYVLGLEPGNCYLMGRHDERENGTLKKIKAFETVENMVKIEFCDRNAGK
ncbi:MAG: aldose 1-epimerase family protein [Lachnospiraceae bacterium]|nr:aldose 1-epimerase family protein [Lachnospiraceae bacterium]